MNQIEARVFELEKAVRKAQDAIRNLTAAVQQLQQQQFATGGGTQGSGGGGGAVLWCTPTAGIPVATGPPATGAPGLLTGQNLFSINAGAFVAGPTNVSLYNGMQAPVVITKTCAVQANADGTFSVVSQSCL